MINYWVFVQYGHLGYRKDSLSWTVKKLKKSTEIDIVCLISETLRSGEKRTCSGATLLNEQFTNHGLTSNQWIQQQYIPNSGPVICINNILNQQSFFIKIIYPYILFV